MFQQYLVTVTTKLFNVRVLVGSRAVLLLGPVLAFLLRRVLPWWPEPERQMKTFCSSVCVNNRYPGNAGSYGTAQRHKHAAQMEKFPAASGVYLASRSGGGSSSRWWASARPHQLLMMASRPSFSVPKLRSWSCWTSGILIRQNSRGSRGALL